MELNATQENANQGNDEMDGTAIVIISKIAPRISRKRKKNTESKATAVDAKHPYQGRTPRITKLMALAIHLQRLIDDEVIKDCAEIARLVKLTRARVSQIMNLNLLAPKIQEEILFLPRILQGIDHISERSIREIVLKPCWDLQLKDWQELMNNVESAEIINH